LLSGICNGSCCVVFPLPGHDPSRDWSKTHQGTYIADMILPLTLEAAKERWALYGLGDWPEPFFGPYPGKMFSCRHWDTETRLCTAYEARPDMCRDYPYGGPCNAGCDFQVEITPDILRRYGVMTASPKFDWTGWRWDRRLRGYHVDPDYAPTDEDWPN